MPDRYIVRDTRKYFVKEWHIIVLTQQHNDELWQTAFGVTRLERTIIQNQFQCSRAKNVCKKSVPLALMKRCH